MLYLNSEYEYETVVINDLITGEIDSEKLQKTLESYALNGWRLHSVFTNEVGRNSGGSFTSFQGDSINAAYQGVKINDRTARQSHFTGRFWFCILQKACCFPLILYKEINIGDFCISQIRSYAG